MSAENILAIILEVDENQDSYKKYLPLFKACAKRNPEQFIQECQKLSLPVYQFHRELSSDNNIKRICTQIESNLALNIDPTPISICNPESMSFILFHFRLNVSEIHDVTNLQYFFLIKQYLAHYDALNQYNILCRMVVLNSNHSMAFRLSNFLILENKKEPCIYELSHGNTNSGTYTYVIDLPGAGTNKGHKITNLSKLYPLLEINQNSYLMLTRTINDTLRLRGYKDGFPKGNVIDYIQNGNATEILLDMCIQYFTRCSADRMELFYSRDFFNAVRGMSLLSFLIFCSFEHFLYPQEDEIELSMDEIKRKINLSTCITNGLLQIIENIVMHTKWKEGYFSFYIKNDEAYLKKTYKHYMEHQPQLPDTMYMEIKICDFELENYSENYKSIILKRFLDRLNKRIKSGEKNLQGIRNKFRNLPVKEFFLYETKNENYREAWTSYYQYEENWMLHYGLRLYAKIINKAEGFFRVNSQYGWESIPDKQYYSTEKADTTPDYFLPGTQYHILLPYITENIEQGHIGIDCNVNTSEKLREIILKDIYTEDISVLKVTQNIIDAPEGQFFTIINSDNDNNGILQQADKEEILKILIDDIKSRMDEVFNKKGNKCIPVWNMQDIDNNIIQELIAKAFWAYSISYEGEADNYFAIKGCTYEMMRYLVNVISVFFGLNPGYRLKKEIQIYICGDNCDDDFLISGDSYPEIRARAYKYATSKGQFPEILSYFFMDFSNGNLPIKQTQDSFQKKDIQVLPFDMLICDNGKSRFIQQIENVLERNISSPEYGCKLENIHVRIGSKVHVQNFFEAELLFQDSYFSKRMAYLVAEDIYKRLNAKETAEKSIQNKELILVGYENYSEMFICDILTFLDTYIKKSNINHYKTGSYTICYNMDGKLELQGINKDVSYKNTEFVIIVSINSTLTTHNKIEATLKKEVDELHIFMNYAVLLFRDDDINISEIPDSDQNINTRRTKLEKRYWERADRSSKTIKSRLTDKEIVYFIEKSAKWQDTLRCPLCFPEIALNEKPLIATTKTSVIPAMQYGVAPIRVTKSRKKIVKPTSSEITGSDSPSQDNKERNVSVELIERKVSVLANHVRYGHIERNDNHFLYYFDTKQLLIENKDEIKRWLKNYVKNEVDTAISKQEIPIYSILVTPTHESNAGFVEMINKNVFGNTAYIVRFEVNRMYRDNLKARYSNLTTLYQRLRHVIAKNEHACINLYFVDDTIISGRTFERAYSLMNSLYYDLQQEVHFTDQRVAVHIFKGCFTLLNRMSKASRVSMMKPECHYYYYFDIPISSIRNHEDFCFMCNLIKNAKQMQLYSSTNQVAQGWKKVEKRFALKPYFEYKLPLEKQERYKNRFYSAFWAGFELRELKEYAEEPELITNMVIQNLFIEKVIAKEIDEFNKMEMFISYVKVLSRPFLNYKWKLKESVLFLIVLFLDMLLKKDITSKTAVNNLIRSSEYGKNVGKNIDEIWLMLKKYRSINRLSYEYLIQAYDLLVVLIKQSMELGSNYIIRKENIKNILTRYHVIIQRMEKLLKNQAVDSKALEKYQEMMDFKFHYIRYIKQLTTLSGDEKKEVWLERLLLHGTEFSLQTENEHQKKTDSCFLKNYGINSSFGQMLYIENSYTISKALADLLTDLRDDISTDHIKSVLEDPQKYYYRSFLDILMIHGWLKGKNTINANLEDPDFIVNILPKKLDFLKTVVDLLILMRTDNGYMKLEEFYETMINYLAKILECTRLQCLVKNYQEDNTLFCLMEAKKDGKNYKVKHGNVLPLLNDQQIPDHKYILRTWQFCSTNECEKEYLVIKFESNTGGAKEENGSEAQEDLSIRPLYFICDVTGKPKDEIVRKLRWVLVLRRDILQRLEQDFRSNAFQNMIQEKNAKKLLSDWKNSTHADNWIYSSVISLMDTQEETDPKKYKTKLQGTVFRLLTDSIISRKYHTSLTREMEKKYDYKNPMVYAFRIPFRKSIIWRYKDSLYDMPQKKEGIVVCKKLNIKPNLKDRKMFALITETEQGMLMLIPIIQNALKYAAENSTVDLYAEENAKLIDVQGNVINGLDYLCISNFVQEPIDNMIEEMEQFIRYPVGLREHTNLDSQNGISLFTVNQYLRNLIQIIFRKQLNSDTQPLKIKLTTKNKMIIKIPILAGIKLQKGEKNGTYYYF